MGEEHAREKDDFEAFFVPPPSGKLLSEFVRGRAVYRPAPGIAVPVLEQVPALDGGYSVMPDALYAFQRNPESVLRPRVVAWLVQPLAQQSRSRDLKSHGHDLAQIKALAAAALHEVAGLRQGAVAEWIEGAGVTGPRRRELLAGAEPERFNTRQIRGRISKGRNLWARLGAWPWWAVRDELGVSELSGAFPDQWWELPRVVATYGAWRECQLRFARGARDNGGTMNRPIGGFPRVLAGR